MHVHVFEIPNNIYLQQYLEVTCLYFFYLIMVIFFLLLCTCTSLAEYFFSLRFNGGVGNIIYHTWYGDLHYIITTSTYLQNQDVT